MRRARRILTIMAKQPVAGAVKTRLAAGLGAARATGFYRAALAAELRRLGGDERWRTVLAVSPDRAAEARCWPGCNKVTTQGRGDVGQRMQHIFDQNPNADLVIIGSDIPGIRPGHIARAFAQLGRHDAVFGPAGDGGFWLVGRRAGLRAALFSDVRWSGPHALADTLRNLESLKTGFLDSLDDIDDIEDYRAWRRSGNLL
ncbi:MAG: hypothetical protein C0605_02160 [Hyphomicrobiales bacterium]|nr:MAG: hypothetical protein C0605_02160 [Hyphomicrobiales bacterium]